MQGSEVQGGVVRINYLRHIYSRNDDELIKKVFIAQKEAPTSGDFVKLVTKDMMKLGLTHKQLENGEISKQELRKCVRNVAFSQLRAIQTKGTKTKSIKYFEFKMQEYLRSELSREEMTTLTSIRSMCVKGVKANFKKMYKLCLHCPLRCEPENPHEDTQEHVLRCSKLSGSNMDIDFMHASVVDQCELARQFSRLMTKRTTLLEDQSDDTSCCRPGASFLDPSSLGAPAAIDSI